MTAIYIGDDAIKEEMLKLLKPVMTATFARSMPDGFSIHRIAEYTPERFTAPSLLFEKRQKPSARYLVILISDTMGVPALGETVVQAVEAAIAKIKSL